MGRAVRMNSGHWFHGVPVLRPPSTTIAWPVTKLDSSLARNSAIAAITGVNLYQIHRFEVVGFRDVFSAVTIQGLRLSFGSFYLL